MSRVARLLCLLAALPVAGCYASDYAIRPKIVQANASGIVIVASAGFNPYNMAALHCQHYGELSVPRGTQISGENQLTYFYACER